MSISRGKVWYYRYDGLGRRIEKACPELGITTTYVWDGDQLAYQQTDTQGKLSHRRHSVFNGWSLLAQQDSYLERDPRHPEPYWREETNYAVTQPNGQPIALFSPEGERTWRQGQHSVWGLRLTSRWTRQQSSPLDPNLLFAGQYYDEESQLAYNRFRYYDPETGSYLTSDPIGLAGGEQPYRYTQNPMDWVDVFGLAGCSTYLQGWGKGRDGFKNFWDNSSYDEFMGAWNNPIFRDNIKARLRGDGIAGRGGYHEWLPVSQADRFKQMGVSFEDYMKWRTPTGQVSFVDNLGDIGSHTPTTAASSLAHKELIGIAQKVDSVSEYIYYVQKWAKIRFPHGSLPF